MPCINDTSILRHESNMILGDLLLGRITSEPEIGRGLRCGEAHGAREGHVDFIGERREEGGIEGGGFWEGGDGDGEVVDWHFE